MNPFEAALAQQTAPAEPVPQPVPKPPAQPSPPPAQEPKQEPSVAEDEPDPSKNVEYELNDTKGLGMVEKKPGDVVGGELKDEEIPPGR